MSISNKPLPFRIPKLKDSLFYLQIDKQDKFYARLHHHPELQLTIILSGEGSLVCGDYLGEFAPGDIFLMGSDVPHVFRSREKQGLSHSVSLFIDPDLPENRMFSEEDQNDLVRLTLDVAGGAKVLSPFRELIAPILADLPNRQGLDQTSAILRIVNFLLKPDSYLSLSPLYPSLLSKERSDTRMNEVIQFTIENADREISLEEAASVASLTRSSFCRYFKQRTRKTYTEYIAEVRINQACQLLRDASLSIREVCFGSGYSNISHFNRHFKAMKGKTPSDYRKEIGIS